MKIGCMFICRGSKEETNKRIDHVIQELLQKQQTGEQLFAVS